MGIDFAVLYPSRGLTTMSIKDDEIRSQPIHAGEFASFCQLKPGRYTYKVVRTDNPTMGMAPSRRLEGEIIVAAAGDSEKSKPAQ